MRHDAAEYQPFSEHFSVEVIMTCSSKRLAGDMERCYIAKFNATGPMGYNNLPAAPRLSDKYYAIAASRRKKQRTAI